MDQLIDQILAPIGRRLGTLVGGALAGAGVASHDVNAIVVGTVALFGVGVDLALLWVKTRKAR